MLHRVVCEFCLWRSFFPSLKMYNNLFNAKKNFQLHLTKRVDNEIQCCHLSFINTGKLFDQKVNL